MQLGTAGRMKSRALPSRIKVLSFADVLNPGILGVLGKIKTLRQQQPDPNPAAEVGGGFWTSQHPARRLAEPGSPKDGTMILFHCKANSLSYQTHSLLSLSLKNVIFPRLYIQ